MLGDPGTAMPQQPTTGNIGAAIPCPQLTLKERVDQLEALLTQQTEHIQSLGSDLDGVRQRLTGLEGQVFS